MYIVKNAVKSITRNKLRNILIGVIVLIISVSACVSLSIRQAAEVAKQDALSGLNVTAQISFDRRKAMEEMKSEFDSDSKSSDSSEKSFDRSKFDFDVLQGSSLTLDEYMTYTKALSDGDGYYYSGAVSLNSADDDLLPYGTEESSSDSSSDDKSSNNTDNNSGRRPLATTISQIQTVRAICLADRWMRNSVLIRVTFQSLAIPPMTRLPLCSATTEATTLRKVTEAYLTKPPTLSSVLSATSSPSTTTFPLAIR